MEDLVRAARLRGRSLDELAITDIAATRPAAGEVAIAVETVSVNQLDLNVIAGVGPGAAAALPRTLGLDPSGVITAVGSDVDPARVGERVVVKPNIPCGDCAWCLSAREADCPLQRVVGVHRDGGAAEYVVVPSTSAFDRGSLAPEVATAAVHSVPIVLNAMDAAAVSASDLVLVTGASGTLGCAAVEVALGLGARVIAASRSDLTVPDGVFAASYAEPSDIPARIAALNIGEPSVVIDVSGHGAVTAAAVATLGWKGRAAFCSSSVAATIPLDGRDFYLRRKSLVGVASADYEHVRRGLRLVSDGTVRPVIGPRFPLARIADAYRAFTAGASGKVIIDVE
ncbi:alcohol dehydrogenase catalytic domain-containing protein [Microbacterium lacus]|uniref:alcohol dehydrogenase catalytic domain-containing protein n=1 Tax=Microbacterium lacus TaxID=415217 RepID=UPI00384F538C